MINKYISGLQNLDTQIYFHLANALHSNNAECQHNLLYFYKKDAQERDENVLLFTIKSKEFLTFPKRKLIYFVHLYRQLDRYLVF